MAQLRGALFLDFMLSHGIPYGLVNLSTKETFHLHHLKDLLKIDVKFRQEFESGTNYKQEIGCRMRVNEAQPCLCPLCFLMAFACRTYLPHGEIAVLGEGGTLDLH
jgi:hypothetical protein